MSFPSIDHSLLSPSGKMSKVARDKALKREAKRLFPPGFWTEPEKTAQEIKDAKILSLQRHAARLRDLANRGVQTRKYNKLANEAEEEIKTLTNSCP